VIIRAWIRSKLVPLAIIVLPLIVAACNNGPGGSGGGVPGY
jgi:predicted small secreted protein